jgi:hypothetical protein
LLSVDILSKVFRFPQIIQKLKSVTEWLDLKFKVKLIIFFWFKNAFPTSSQSNSKLLENSFVNIKL